MQKIFIITGILIVALFGLVYYLNSKSSPANQSLSADPEYKEVKEKYDLDESQLEILSRVRPD